MALTCRTGYLVDMLRIGKKHSADLLAEWLKDKNPLNREKAAYLLDIVGNVPH